MLDFRKYRTWLEALIDRRYRATSFIALIGITSVLAIFGPPQTTIGRSDQSVYSTGIGEIRVIELSDNTTVRLNTNSRIVASYSSTERHVELIRGEALFAPAHSDSRAFSVSASNYRVRDVGTHFSVRIGNENTVTVLVTDGQVLLAPRDAHEPQRSGVNLHSGDEGIATRNKVVANHLGLEELRRQLAWIDGMLQFNGETLDIVVAEINRYNQVQIVMVDPSILKVQVAASFTGTDPLSFVIALERMGVASYEYDSQLRVIKLFRHSRTVSRRAKSP